MYNCAVAKPFCIHLFMSSDSLTCSYLKNGVGQWQNNNSLCLFIAVVLLRYRSKQDHGKISLRPGEET